MRSDDESSVTGTANNLGTELVGRVLLIALLLSVTIRRPIPTRITAESIGDICR